MSFLMMAAAASAATMNCVIDRVPAAEAATLGGGLMREMFSADAKSEDSPVMAELVGPLTKRVVRCQRKHKWTEEQADAAVLWTIAQLALPDARALVSAAGAEPARIERAYPTLADEHRLAFTNQDDGDDDPAVAALLEAAEKEGVTVYAFDIKLANAVGVLFAIIAISEKASQDFAAR